MNEERSAVHASVRSAYAQQARVRLERGVPHQASCCGGGSSCCGDSCNGSADSDLYPLEALAALPSDVAEATWGCGDPVTLAGLRSGEVVLDLGSGGGLDCLLAARRVGPTGRAIGVDMTPEMLSLAWRNAARTETTNVDFRQGQIEQLPVESASVDVVMSNCVINLSPDKDATFREIARVLKPGGRVSISDIVLLDDISPELQADMHLWSSCVAGAWPEERYVEAMRQAGLSDVTVASRVIVDVASYTGDQRAAAELDGKVASVRITARRPLP